MKHTILLFIRMGSLERITDLYENGTVYMNTLKHFKETKDANLRGDPWEGAIDLTVPKDATIKFSFMDREFKPASLSYGSYLKTGNLYCLYCVSSYGFPSPQGFRFDEKNLEFGSHCLMIKQPGIFIEKVEVELRRLGYSFEHDFVEYYREKVELRNLTPFHKLDIFDYQKEFRFFVQNEEDKPIKLQIGSMESYSEIFETKDLLKLELNPK